MYCSNLRNGQYGDVCDFFSKSSRFNVRLLGERTSILSLKRENLTIVNPSTMSEDVINVSTKNPMFQAVFNYPRLIRGVQSIPDSEGIYKPKSYAASGLVLCMQNSTDIIEIEDLLISVAACCRGRIIFRRCHITGASDAGVSVCLPPSASSRESDDVDVIFENCLIENCVGSGIIVDGIACKATLINCVVRNNGVFGAEIRNRGLGTILHCRFVNNSRSQIIGYQKAHSLEVNNCSLIGGGDSGILVVEGCSAIIRHTKIDGAKFSGVAIEDKGSALIEMCDIQNCLHGLLAQTGKCIVTMRNCNISKNQLYGVFITIDCIGSITMEGNMMSSNMIKAIENSGGEKCIVTVDGSTFSTNGFDHHMMMTNPAKFAKAFDAAVDIVSRRGKTESGMKVLKARKKAGLVIGVPTCGECHKLEPANEKFLLCGKCMEAVYCTKECQRNHWSQHKTICKVKVKNPCFLDPTVSTRHHC